MDSIWLSSVFGRLLTNASMFYGTILFLICLEEFKQR